MTAKTRRTSPSTGRGESDAASATLAVASDAEEAEDADQLLYESDDGDGLPENPEDPEELLDVYVKHIRAKLRLKGGAQAKAALPRRVAIVLYRNQRMWKVWASGRCRQGPVTTRPSPDSPIGPRKHQSRANPASQA